MGDWSTALGKFDLPEQFLALEPGEARRVRFLGGLDDSVAIQYHERWGRMRPQPCVAYTGEQCVFCQAGTFKNTYRRVWTVFDYGAGARRLVVVRATRELTSLIAIGDARDFRGRDLIVRRVEKRNEFRFEEPEKPGLQAMEPCTRCTANPECDGGPFCGCECHDGGLMRSYTFEEVVEVFKPLIRVKEMPPDMDDIPEGRIVRDGDPMLGEEEEQNEAKI